MQRAQIGTFTRMRSCDVAVDADTLYPFVGVLSHGRGAFLSGRRLGSTTSYKYLTQVRRDDFVYPKLMAWEQAVAVIPPEFDGMYVTPEFPAFEIDQSVCLSRYFEAAFLQPDAAPVLRSLSPGTNLRRRRLKPAVFSNISLALPTLRAQKQIVVRMDNVLSRIREHHSKRAATLSELELLITRSFEEMTSAAPSRPMCELAPLVRRGVEVDPDASYPELGIRSFGKGTFHKPAVTGVEIGSKRLFRIATGDLIFNIVFAWEGAVAVAGPNDEGRFGSHRFLTCVADERLTSAAFLEAYFRTDSGLAKLRRASPGGAGRNRTLGLEALANISCPCPPLHAQRQYLEIVSRVAELRRLQNEQHYASSALQAAILREAVGNPLNAPRGTH